MRIYPTNNTNILEDIEGAFWGHPLFKNLLIVDCLNDFNLFALRNNFTSPIFIGDRSDLQSSLCLRYLWRVSMAEVASELETGYLFHPHHIHPHLKCLCHSLSKLLLAPNSTVQGEHAHVHNEFTFRKQNESAGLNRKFMELADNVEAAPNDDPDYYATVD